MTLLVFLLLAAHVAVAGIFVVPASIGVFRYLVGDVNVTMPKFVFERWMRSAQRLFASAFIALVNLIVGIEVAVVGSLVSMLGQLGRVRRDQIRAPRALLAAFAVVAIAVSAMFVGFTSNSRTAQAYGQHNGNYQSGSSYSQYSNQSNCLIITVVNGVWTVSTTCP